MTDVPKKLIVDLESGTQQYVDLTPEEIEQRELDAIAAATAQAEREEAAEALAALKASAKAKLVAGTPLTEEEAATLVI
jgi:DNA invertase Pin-like site-specific DNA recombinase